MLGRVTARRASVDRSRESLPRPRSTEEVDIFLMHLEARRRADRQFLRLGRGDARPQRASVGADRDHIGEEPRRLVRDHPRVDRQRRRAAAVACRAHMPGPDPEQDRRIARTRVQPRAPPRARSSRTSSCSVA